MRRCRAVHLAGERTSETRGAARPRAGLRGARPRRTSSASPRSPCRGASRARRGRLPRGRRVRHVLRRPLRPRARRARARRRPPDHARHVRARATSSASWRCSTTSAARRRSRRSTTLEVLAILGRRHAPADARHPEIAVKLVDLARAPAAGGQRAARAPVLPDRAEPRGRRARPARRAGARRGRRRARRAASRPRRPTWRSSPAPRASRPAASWPCSSGRA